MVTFNYGVSVTVSRPGGVDRHGDPLPAAEHAIPGCALAPASSSEREDRRDQVITTLTLYAPSGSDLRATDRVIIPGGLVYRVQGDPADWRDPFDGWTPGMTAELERVTG